MDVPWDARFEPVIRKALIRLDDDEPLRPDQSTAAVGLDSLGAVELLGMIEDEYHIVIPDELLEFENFATPAKLWSLVASVRAAGATAAEGGDG